MDETTVIEGLRKQLAEIQAREHEIKSAIEAACPGALADLERIKAWREVWMQSWNDATLRLHNMKP